MYTGQWLTMTNALSIALILVFLLAPAAATAQSHGTSVVLSGDVPNPIVLTRESMQTMSRATVTVDSGGMPVTYEGVWLHELLRKAGLPGGEDIRGKLLSAYVMAQASDGYQVLFGVAEVDPAFTEGQVLLADTGNGKALSGPNGNFRLVVPRDKRGARSLRMLEKLTVVQVRK
jgi:hypothetical protein